MEPEPLLLPGAGADPIWSEPESALGASQKNGGSATQNCRKIRINYLKNVLVMFIVGVVGKGCSVPV